MNARTANAALGLAALAAGWYLSERSQASTHGAQLLGLFFTGGALASLLSKPERKQLS